MNNKDKLKELLLSNMLFENINETEKIVFDIIPELEIEKGFDQKNKWHCYDIWMHTIETLRNSDKDFIIRTALLLHDLGKPFSCQEVNNVRHFKGHADKSYELAKDILIRLGYSIEQIDEICFLIKNHASKINLDDINSSNASLYRKLLHIQYCDAKGYAKEYQKEAIDKLDEIKRNMIKD